MAANIPFNRPLFGRDLEDFRRRFGLTVDDACFVCGITKNRWFLMASKEKDLALRDVPLSIMIRLIDQDPTLMFVPDFIPPTQLLDTITAEVKITKREFSVLMGNNGTSANRWTVSRKRASPVVHRLSYVVNSMIQRTGMTRSLNKLRDIVKQESLARGIPDVFNSARWTVPGEPRRPSGTKKTAVDAE